MRRRRTGVSANTLYIDGLNLCFRQVFSGSNLKSNDSSTSVIYGGIVSIKSLIEKFSPKEVIFVLEGKNSRSRRKAIYPEYKAHRKMNLPIDKDEFYEQIADLEDFLYALGVDVVKVNTYEADDVIAVLSKANTSSSIIVSTDGDYLQLVDKKIAVYSPTKDLLITHKNFREVVGISANDFLDWKCMVGDTSDNIKGITGIGEKTATAICNFMGYQRTLEAGIDNVDKKWKKLFAAGAKKQFELANKLIDLSLTELTLEEVKVNLIKGNYDEDEVRDLLEDFEMWTLRDNFEGIEVTYGLLGT